MPFTISFGPIDGPSGSDLWFVFRGDRLLVKTAETLAEIPRACEINSLGADITGMHYIGALDGTGCYAVDAGGESADPDGMAFMELRPLLVMLDEESFAIASRAYQFVHWERMHQFCGRCGSRLGPKSGERAKVCPQCSLTIFPEISPAIIVAVTRGSEILLAHSKRFQAKFYSVLAGFVEQGETFEQTVRREVKEEVGIDVKDITYFGSQPWPFPNSIMVGFTAEYESGEISIDESELNDAKWFTPDNLPNIPRKGTIARRLIENFIARAK
jgi:NAD+ diphosphatase